MIEHVLKLYTCIDHAGFWPVGVASIVIAENEAEARICLDEALMRKGLKPSREDGTPYTLIEIPLKKSVHILCDGDY
jgi:hypothetical protein